MLLPQREFSVDGTFPQNVPTSFGDLFSHRMTCCDVPNHPIKY